MSRRKRASGGGRIPIVGDDRHRYRGIFQICLIHSLNFIGFLGLVFVIYGSFEVTISKALASFSTVARQLVSVSSAVLTLVSFGILLITTRLYGGHSRPPDKHTLQVVIPFLGLLLLAVVLQSIVSNSLPSDFVLIGLSILGLVGAIHRELPFTEGESP